MKLMHITYAQMKRNGLNVPIMQHFGFSLLAWSSLDFDARDVGPMSENDCMSLFGMSVKEIQDILSIKYVE